MSNKPVTDGLKKLLAQSYTLYLKTQNYHWNVTGPNFQSLHLLFEQQYTDLALAVDTIAERIRALGAKAPASFVAYQKSGIADGNENATATRMVKELYEDQQVVIATLRKTLKLAQKAEDEATAGLVTDRLTVHEKAAWMLKSSV